jgi:hypothetical protein
MSPRVRGCERGDVGEIVIAFQRPPSMSTAELRAWVVDRALERQRALALSAPGASWGQRFRLRVETDDEATDTAEEELAELMLDMRLLGFEPVVVAPAE